ncbi:hypothetical protein D3C72_1950370 [compost metagenome]
MEITKKDDLALSTWLRLGFRHDITHDFIINELEAIAIANAKDRPINRAIIQELRFGSVYHSRSWQDP